MKPTSLSLGCWMLICGAVPLASAQQILYSPGPDSHYDRVRRQAELVGGLASNLRRQEELRARRERAFVDALYQVEVASIPLPDDPPIRYPDAATWRELSSRRLGYAHADTESAETTLQHALESPAEVHFVQVPLAAAIEYLREQYGIELQIDERALADIGVGSDTPITKHLSGISLRSVLRHMLRDFGLTFVAEDDVIVITSQAAARRQVQTRVYPVGDLFMPRPVWP